MFAIVNLRTATVAGLMGVLVLFVVALAARPAARQPSFPGREAS